MISAGLKSTNHFQRKLHRPLYGSTYLVGMLLSMTILCSCSTPADVDIKQSIQGLYDADLSSDGNTSLIASIHHGASLWNTQSHERLYNWNHTPGQYSQLNFVALAGNGTVGLTAIQRDLVAWNSIDGKPIEFWQLPDQLSCLEINELGSHAVIGMISGQAMIIDIKNKGFIWTGKLSDRITACAFDLKEHYLALGTQAGQVQLYSIQQKNNEAADPIQMIPKFIWTLQPVLSFNHPYAINHVNISSKPHFLLSGSQHHELWVTDIESKVNIHKIPLKNASVSHSIFYENSIILAYTSREIEFIDFNQWKTTQKITMPKQNVWKAAGVHISSIAYSQNILTATGSDGVTHRYKNISP